ncbi:MAG TPA: GGDEF domain-containing protein [Nocardioides sp.]|nr:GGDEF domain-containing protein [Nocardioides sp.]
MNGGETVVLDTATLRVAFGVVAICVLLLFYGVTYRTTRSPYSGWWCVSLALFIASSGLFLLNDTPVQVVANPAGNALAVLGAAGVWAAAASLRGRSLRSGALLAGPAVVLLVSLLDDPRNDVWSGGAVFLVGMSLMIGLSFRELFVLARSPETAGETAQQRVALGAMAGMSAVMAAFYLGRAGAFVAVGPDDDVFRTAFGSQATTLLTMILLVVVTFSMSALSHERQTTLLRLRATRDDLTGLLNRSEFRVRAAERIPRTRRFTDRPAAMIMADLDGFKALNDGHGHAAGDRALGRFGAACLASLPPDDLAGRLGGDEFGLLLADGSSAESVAAEIRRRFRAGDGEPPLPSVSFGIAPVRPGDDVDRIVARADAALYRAKSGGRNRAVRFDDLEDRAGA